MTELKDILASNLIKLRKSKNYTQAELASKLNYSDKSVSKWERGEAVPDIYVLKQIADFYGTTVDKLISSEIEESEAKKLDKRGRNRIVVSLMSSILSWLVAVTLFVILSVSMPSYHKFWQVFIYNLPAFFIVLLVFSSIHKKRFAIFAFTSLLMWSVALTLFIIFILFIPAIDAPWLIFLCPIPLQILTIMFVFGYKKKKLD